MEEKGDEKTPTQGHHASRTDAQVIRPQTQQELAKLDNILQTRPISLQNDFLASGPPVKTGASVTKIIKKGETKILQHNIQPKIADVPRVISTVDPILVSSTNIATKIVENSLNTNSLLNPAPETKEGAVVAKRINSVASFIQNQPESINHQSIKLRSPTVIKHIDTGKPRTIKAVTKVTQFAPQTVEAPVKPQQIQQQQQQPKSVLSFDAIINQPQTVEPVASVRIIRTQPTIQTHTVVTKFPVSAVVRKTATTTVVAAPIPVKPPEPAAPLPALPSAAEITTIIKEIANEIHEQELKIEEIQQEKMYGMISVPPTSEATEKCQIMDFHNNIYPKGNIPDIMLRNKEIISNSHKKYAMPQEMEACKQKYKHVTQLPQFMKEIENGELFMEPMLQALSQKVATIDLKKIQLAHEYQERREKWNESNFHLSIYQKEKHESINSWPPEFAKSTIKPNDKTTTQYAAKDNLMEMYLDPEEKEAMLYFDENSFVADPVKEHNQFKMRVSWTEQEKQIFVEKYSQHPKEFKKIASALPSKCIKDVIEFYFINRIKLNLKAADTASRKRGRKRIITEGSL